MPKLVAIAVWLFISAYAFYILGHPRPGRERIGRRLVAIGALLVAAVLAIPARGGSYNLGDVLAVIGIGLAGVFIGAGLLLAFPGGRFGRKDAATDEDADSDE